MATTPRTTRTPPPDHSKAQDAPKTRSKAKADPKAGYTIPELSAAIFEAFSIQMARVPSLDKSDRVNVANSIMSAYASDNAIVKVDGEAFSAASDTFCEAAGVDQTTWFFVLVGILSDHFRKQADPSAALASFTAYVTETIDVISEATNVPEAKPVEETKAVEPEVKLTPNLTAPASLPEVTIALNEGEFASASMLLKNRVPSEKYDLGQQIAVWAVAMPELGIDTNMTAKLVNHSAGAALELFVSDGDDRLSATVLTRDINKPHRVTHEDVTYLVRLVSSPDVEPQE